jgi:predicted transcriptional regulator
MKTLQKEIYTKAEEVQRLSDKLNKDKQELRKAMKAFVESFYLSLQTRNRFPIPKEVADVIEKNLDILVEFSFENEKDLKNWAEEIKKLLGIK